MCADRIIVTQHSQNPIGRQTTAATDESLGQAQDQRLNVLFEVRGGTYTFNYEQ